MVNDEAGQKRRRLDEASAPPSARQARGERPTLGVGPFCRSHALNLLHGPTLAAFDKSGGPRNFLGSIARRDDDFEIALVGAGSIFFAADFFKLFHRAWRRGSFADELLKISVLGGELLVDGGFDIAIGRFARGQKSAGGADDGNFEQAGYIHGNPIVSEVNKRAILIFLAASSAGRLPHCATNPRFGGVFLRGSNTFKNGHKGARENPPGDNGQIKSLGWRQGFAFLKTDYLLIVQPSLPFTKRVEITPFFSSPERAAMISTSHL